MKLFSKLALAVIFLCVTINVDARTPISLGVKAGLGISNLSGSLDKNTTNVAYNGGLTIDFKISPSFYILSGLEFTTKPIKGGDTKITQDIESNLIHVTYSRIKANASYLQIPIHAGYKFGLSKDAMISLHAGPYIAYGIGGNIKLEVYDAFIFPLGQIQIIDPEDFPVNKLYRYKYKTFSDEGFDRFDFGFSGGLTFDFKRFNVNLDYDLGVTKHKPTDLEVRNGKVYFSLGYKFLTR